MINKNENKKERAAIAKKKKLLEQIYNDLINNKTCAIVDLRSLPDRILQKARKDLRTKAKIIISKKAVLNRALEKAKINTKIKINFPAAIIVSNSLTPYQIYQSLKATAQKIYAKPGQIAPEDIIVHAQDTDLPPGPALTELKNAKINAIIKAGKISIQKDSVVAKKGEPISEIVAKVLQKLDIKPFQTGMKCLEVIYEGLNYTPEILEINEQTLNMELGFSIQCAKELSIQTNYPSEYSIERLLTNSYAQAKSLATQTGAYSNAYADELVASAIRQAEVLKTKTST